MYKLIKNLAGDKDTGVSTTNDNGSVTTIPFDPANTDYQEFLRWCEAGNEPLPADSQE